MITVADLQGHWQRDWIEAQGTRDETTRVHWLQARATYADIRVPLDRPRLSGACLADLPQPVLARLLAAEGFAGTITVEDGVCTWARRINLHGFPCPVDAGWMSWGPEGQLYEDGVHADYREQWRHVPATAFTAAICNGPRTVIVVFNETTFLIITGPEGAPAQPQLRKSLEAGTAKPEEIEAAFATSCSFGHWQGEDGIADLSTNPFNEGRAVLSRTSGGLTWHDTAFEGSLTRQTLPTSSISEVSA